MNSIGKYAKTIVGVSGAIITSLAPYYGSDLWFTALSSGITAVLVYLVPNQTA